MPYETMATAPQPAGVWDVGAYAAWIGTHVSNIPRVASNAVKGGANIAIDLVVPGECVGVMVTDFTDEVAGRVPFSYFVAVRAAMAADADNAIEFGVVEIGGTSVDLSDALAGAADAMAPWRDILALLPWAIAVGVVTRIVMKTLGSSDGSS